MNLILWIHGIFLNFLSLLGISSALPNRRLRSVFPQSHSTPENTWNLNQPPWLLSRPGHAAANCDLRSSKLFSSSNKCIHLNKFGYRFFFSPPSLSFFFLSGKTDCMLSAKLRKILIQFISSAETSHKCTHNLITVPLKSNCWKLM